MLKTVLVALLMVLTAATQAQQWLGFAHSSYGGLHSALYNPAYYANTRLRLQVGIVGANSTITSNYLQFRGGLSVSDAVDLFTLQGNTIDEISKSDFGGALNAYFNKGKIEENLNGDVKNINLNIEARGPFVLFSNDRFGAGLYFRSRAAIQVNGVSQDLARLLYRGAGDLPAEQVYRIISSSSFNLGLNVYHELGAGIGTRIFNFGPHHVSVGGNLKYLMGIYSINAASEGFTVRPVTEDSLVAIDSRLGFQYVDASYIGKARDILFKPLGRGTGIDAGAIYEYRPADDGEFVPPGYSRHKLRVGIAVNDLGFITYSSSKYVRSFDLISRSGGIAWGGIDTLNISQPRDFENIASQVFGLKDTKSRFTYLTPAVLNIHADLHVKGNFYVAVSTVTNLKFRSAFGLRSFSSYTISPRIEHKIYEVSLPIGVGLSGTAFQLGTFFRVGGFYLGSDNLASIFGQSLGNSGLDFYVGGYVPLHKKRS